MWKDEVALLTFVFSELPVRRLISEEFSFIQTRPASSCGMEGETGPGGASPRHSLSDLTTEPSVEVQLDCFGILVLIPYLQILWPFAWTLFPGK